MYIICSNPAVRDELPWRDVEDLPFKERLSIITETHEVSTNAGKRSVSLPVFVTCDAKRWYYELLIKKDGTSMLFNGLSEMSRFLFRSL
jgi:hypothetical protein